MELFQTNLGRLRLVAFLEGVSFLVLLFICMPLKYYGNMPMPNKIVGMTHGILLLMYCAFLYVVQEKQSWPWKKSLWAVLAALIPFGTFVADVKLFRTANNGV